MAHPGPPVYIEVDVADDHVAFRFTGEQNTILHWLRDRDGAGAVDDPDRTYADVLAPIEPALERDLSDRIRALLDEYAEITVDGAPAEYTVRDLDVPTDDVTGYGVIALTFTLHVPCDTAAERVGMVWSLWERVSWPKGANYEQTKLPVMVRAFGDGQLFMLRPEEPAFTWHVSLVDRKPRREVVAIEAPPPPTLDLPLVSLGAGVLGIVVAVLAVFGKVGRFAALVFVVGMGLSAWLGRALAVVTVADPFSPAVVVPSADDARAMFEQLQSNIYAAFDARSEDEIYDLLAKSVTPNLIDELYGEIYESLIMRGEGGAVCAVEDVEVVEGTVDTAPEPAPWDDIPEALADRPRFDVTWLWEVRGVVSHWGHEHRRLNRYEADWSVVHDGQNWRIAAVDIVDHERIDSDG